MNKVELETAEIIQPKLNALGYNIVQIKLKTLPAKKGQTAGKLMEVMIENLNNTPINIKDCVKVNKIIDKMIIEKELAEEVFQNCGIEVSSPGINRPLLSAKDFIKYIGNKAKVKLKTPINGKTMLRGIIISADDNKADLKVGEEINQVLLTNIANAELDIDIKI